MAAAAEMGGGGRTAVGCCSGKRLRRSSEVPGYKISLEISRFPTYKGLICVGSSRKEIILFTFAFCIFFRSLYFGCSFLNSVSLFFISHSFYFKRCTLFMIDAITDMSGFKSAISLCAFHLLYLIWGFVFVFSSPLLPLCFFSHRGLAIIYIVYCFNIFV